MPSSLFCPQCMSELKLDASQTSASCAAHGAYRVLFSRTAAQETENESDEQLSLQPVEVAPVATAAAAPVEKARTPLSDKANDESLRALSALGLSGQLKPEVAAAGAPVLAGKCAKHPRMDSVQTCTQCNAPMCRMCTYRAPYGKKLCQACLSGNPVVAAALPTDVAAASATITQYAAANPSAFPTAAAAPAAAPTVPTYLMGVKCSTHPDVQAVNKCKVCSAGVCETCDFRVGSNVHACPECIMKPREGISAARLKYVVGGFVCAGVTAFFYVMGEIQGSSAYMIFSLITSMVGVAVSFAPMEKRLTNSIPLWIGAILNLLFFALRIVIVLILTLSR